MSQSVKAQKDNKETSADCYSSTSAGMNLFYALWQHKMPEYEFQYTKLKTNSTSEQKSIQNTPYLSFHGPCSQSFVSFKME